MWLWRLTALCLFTVACASTESNPNKIWVEDGEYSNVAELTYLNPGPNYRETIDVISTTTESSATNDDYSDSLSAIEYGDPICTNGPTWNVTKRGRKEIRRSTMHLGIKKLSKNEFPPLLFYHFCRVESFVMTNLNLTEVKPEYFENAEYLGYLNLSQNAIQRIEAKAFANLAKLISIDLSFNQIEFIDDHAFNHQKFGGIYLNDNKLTTVNWQQFLPLPLEQVALEALAEDVEQRIDSNLFFAISNNQWSKSSNWSVVKGRYIHINNIGCQKLQIFPRKYGLSATNNQISEIVLTDPNQKYDLSKLNVAHNLLTSISILSHLENLRDIDLSYNLIEDLENVFLKLKKLETVSLRHNKLKFVNFGYQLNTGTLFDVDVSYNNLGAFSLKGYFPELRELHIEGNNLTALASNIRKVAPRLRRIGLNDNNWNCDYLFRLFELVKSEELEMLQSEILPNWSPTEYSGAVMGIRCFDEAETPSLADFMQPCSAVNGTSNADVEKLVNSKVAQIETFLLAYFTKKFDELKRNEQPASPSIIYPRNSKK